jgi:Fe2+ transport system protein FeoA
MPSENAVPLCEAPRGRPLRLNGIQGGARLNRRLVELGLTPGVRLRVLQDSGGPLILAVRDSRIALGRGMAEKLTVTILEDEPA